MTTMSLTAEQELLLLHFWSLSVEIARKLPIEIRQDIEGLQRALELAAAIPAAIGWEKSATALLRYVIEPASAADGPPRS
jgi:hypothetical protein